MAQRYTPSISFTFGHASMHTCPNAHHTPYTNTESVSPWLIDTRRWKETLHLLFTEGFPSLSRHHWFTWSILTENLEHSTSSDMKQSFSCGSLVKRMEHGHGTQNGYSLWKKVPGSLLPTPPYPCRRCPGTQSKPYWLQTDLQPL